MNQTNKKYFVKLGFLVVAVLVIMFVFFSVRSSKETVKNALNVTVLAPRTTPKTSVLPEFNGFDALLARGVSSDQLTGLKYSFYSFSQQNHTKIKQVTLNAATIYSVPPDLNHPSATNTITFSTTLDSTTYKARLDYSGVSSIQLRLYSSSGQLVYDSGPFDINS